MGCRSLMAIVGSGQHSPTRRGERVALEGRGFSYGISPLARCFGCVGGVGWCLCCGGHGGSVEMTALLGGWAVFQTFCSLRRDKSGFVTHRPPTAAAPGQVRLRYPRPPTAAAPGQVRLRHPPPAHRGSACDALWVHERHECDGCILFGDVARSSSLGAEVGITVLFAGLSHCEPW